MKLNDALLTQLAALFESIEYGKITFKVSPEMQTLDYEIASTHKIPIEKQGVYYAPAVLEVMKNFNKELDKETSA